MQSPPTSPRFRLECATRSDLGMRRATNQDAVATAPSDACGVITGDRVLMVADGMGAHAAGELASKMAVDHVPHAYLKCAHSAPTALRKAVRDANKRIHAKGNSSHEFHGMGTTCSCLVLSSSAALVAHVGDSRVYRLRDGLLEQLTFDHSLVWEMAAASHVSEDKVPSCIPKNVITRSLGPQESVNVDLEGPHKLADGDAFLLCSDGLSGVVDDAVAGAIIDAFPPDEAAQTLVDLANLRGGPDNISVVVARVSRADSAAKSGGNGGSIWGRVAAALAVAAVCLAAFGWFFVRENAFGALVAAAGCGGAAAAAAIRRSTVVEATPSRWTDGSYGNGPYRSLDCREPRAAAESLRGLVSELATVAGASASAVSVTDSQASIAAVVVVDWSPHADRQREAETSLAGGDYRQAVRLYGELIRSVMKSIREDDGTRRYRAPGAAAPSASAT